MDEIGAPETRPPQEACPEIIEGRHIVAFLAAKGWKQSALGEMLGVTQCTISRWMRGEQEPTARANLQLRKMLISEGFFPDGTSVPMEPHDTTATNGAHVRLVEARVTAGFRSARAASEHHSWKESSYRSHENGARPIKHAAAIEYGRAFNISADWLLSGVGEAPVPTDHPISPVHHNTVSMTEMQSGLYRLRIDKVVPRAVALQIMGLLPNE